MEDIIEKVSPDGKIELPPKILEFIGVRVGEDIVLTPKEKEVLIRPRKRITKELKGCVKADSQIVDEVVENEEFYEY